MLMEFHLPPALVDHVHARAHTGRDALARATHWLVRDEDRGKSLPCLAARSGEGELTCSARNHVRIYARYRTPSASAACACVRGEVAEWSRHQIASAVRRVSQIIAHHDR